VTYLRRTSLRRSSGSPSRSTDAPTRSTGRHRLLSRVRIATAGERAVQPTNSNAGYLYAADRGVGPTNPLVVSAMHSGTDLEWPQLGIGLGTGIALALGQMLMLRQTTQRPLAH
jgi:hypothetical protein